LTKYAKNVVHQVGFINKDKKLSVLQTGGLLNKSITSLLVSECYITGPADQPSAACL